MFSSVVVDGKKTFVTYEQWADRIQASFEKNYYVPADASEDAKYNVNSNLINRRGIYKDVFGSGEGREWSDYQVRLLLLLRSFSLPSLLLLMIAARFVLVLVLCSVILVRYM